MIKTHKLPGLQRGEVMASFANELLISLGDDDHVPVGIQESHDRLDKFLVTLRELNYQFAITGMQYTKNPDYRLKLANLKSDFIRDLYKIIGE